MSRSMTTPLIEEIVRLDRAPEPFQPGDASFWDDPHISEGLLHAHLDEATEAASRPSTEIDRAVAWLSGSGLLGTDVHVLDLGCGPGLYAERMARIGCAVSGIDLSKRSIAFAQERAERAGLSIDYRVANFLELDERAAFDVVMQVYGELSTFDDATRDDLLARIHRALAPGGVLVFDVSTPFHRQRVGAKREWSSSESGFWRPHPHLVLQAGYRYPENVWCDQYLVVDADGVTAYRMWFRDYAMETLVPMLERAGFAVERVAGSLTGASYEASSEWIGVVARKSV